MARKPISGGIAIAKAKRITPKQKVARRKNIAVARMHRKKSVRSTEAASYLEWRSYGKSKATARKLAKRAGRIAYRKLFVGG